MVLDVVQQLVSPVNKPYTVKPVLSDHIKQDIFRLFRQVVAYYIPRKMQF